MRHPVRLSILLAQLGLVFGCGSAEAPGSELDAASLDAASLDAGTTEDVGATEDTGHDAAEEDAAATDAGRTDAGRPDAGPLPPFCDPPPAPAAELIRTRWDGQLPTLLPDGRAITPAGLEIETGGFPIEIVAHPSLPIAYVAIAGWANEHRSVMAIDVTTGTILQEIVRDNAFFGLALTRDGSTLYASSGRGGLVERYAVAADGRLTESGEVSVPGFPAGLVLSADESRLYVAQFLFHPADARRGRRDRHRDDDGDPQHDHGRAHVCL